MGLFDPALELGIDPRDGVGVEVEDTDGPAISRDIRGFRRHTHDTDVLDLNRIDPDDPLFRARVIVGVLRNELHAHR